MTDDALADMVRELRDEVRDLRAELAQLREVRGADEVLSVGAACDRFGLSRSTFDRLLSDPRTGLREVVYQPRKGCKIGVPRLAFERWLAARDGRGTGAARRRP